MGSAGRLLQVEGKVRRPGSIGGSQTAGYGGREQRLKKLLAEQMLDNAALKDLVGKNF